MDKKQIELRKKFKELCRKTLPSWVTAKSVERTKYGIKLEGSNKTQQFIEYLTRTGRQRGMIMKVRKESFWSVWKDNEVQTVKIADGRWEILGNRNKAKALRILQKSL